MMIGKGMAGMAGGMARGAGYMGHGIAGGPWGALVFVGVILLVIAVVYFARINKKKKSSEQNALQALKLKFVEGEITEQEYDQRKNVLLENKGK